MKGKRGRPKGSAATLRAMNIKHNMGDRIDKYSEESGIPKSVIVDKALRMYFEVLDAKKGRYYEN